MANFEEKILAYLDGSLSEADREDVLDGISGERIVGDAARSEERDLFNVHMRLQNIYSAVRTPVSAPLSVQRELAAQIPVLAIKLPYLAAENERRDKFAAGWLSSIRSSWVNVFLLLTLVLLAGGVWYVVNDNAQRGTASTDGSSPANGSTISNGSASSPMNMSAGGAAVGSSSINRVANTTFRNAPQNISSSNASPLSTSALHSSTLHSNVRTSGTTTSNGDISGSSPSHSSISPHRTSTNHTNGSASHSSAIAANVSKNMRLLGTRVGHSNGPSSNRASNANKTIADQNNKGSANTNAAATTNESQQNNPAGIPAADINSNSNVNSANLSANGNLAKPLEPELPPLPLHSVKALEKPIGFDPQHTIPIGFQAQDNVPSFVPMRAFVSSGPRLLMLPSNLNKYVLNDTKQGLTGNAFVQSYEAGVEYEISPWTSAGVHFGLTSFPQYQSFTHPQSLTTNLSNQYLDDSVQSPLSAWCALAVTETFNPQDKARFSLTLAGGPAFTAPIAWLGMIEPNLTYDISEKLMLRGGISYDIARVQQSTQSAGAPNGTSGIIIASSGGTLTSSAIGVNLGISFHP